MHFFGIRPMQRILKLIIWVSVYVYLIHGDSTLGKPPNVNWKCLGCRGEIQEQLLFGYIHNSLYHQKDERNVFLTVDMSWVDSLLQPDAKVHVTLLEASMLYHFIHPETAFEKYSSVKSNTYEDEVFYLTIVELPSNYSMPRDIRQSAHHFRRHYSRSSVSTSPIFLGIDSFLLNNPCWLPLSEPVQVHAQHSTFASSPLLILSSLPHVPLHSTCVMFHTLIRSQFPQHCIYRNDTMTRIELPNIGYASILSQLVDAFADNFCNECKPPYKVFVTPTAEGFYSRTLNITNPATNKIEAHHDGWSWADPLSCPVELQIHDPWACNFLPLSNCSDRYKTEKLTKESIHIWYTPSSFLTRHGLDQQERKKVGDQPMALDEHWSQYRFAAFVQRPNAQMRQLIRNSMHQLYLLDNSRSSERGGGSSGVAMMALAPCVSIHMRHGDQSLDHRAKTGVDRTISGHMGAAESMMRSLGIKKVFLATDNVSVIETIDLKYPQYSFYWQRRPMSQKVHMFKQFLHKYDSKDNQEEEEDTTVIIPGVHNRRSHNYTAATMPADLRESEAATLSHILAEWRSSSHCSAMVGAFDSGYSQRMYQVMSAVSHLGNPPPSVDLRKFKFELIK